MRQVAKWPENKFEYYQVKGNPNVFHRSVISFPGSQISLFFSTISRFQVTGEFSISALNDTNLP